VIFLLFHTPNSAVLVSFSLPEVYCFQAFQYVTLTFGNGSTFTVLDLLMEWQEAGEGYVMRSFITCTLH
jgi:hypothetical protein